MSSQSIFTVFTLLLVLSARMTTFPVSSTGQILVLRPKKSRRHGKNRLLRKLFHKENTHNVSLLMNTQEQTLKVCVLSVNITMNTWIFSSIYF